ncbi:21866_t:CDS:1, partial [Racocetra persica]
YAILYAKYSYDKTDLMSPLGGLYVSFIDYNTANTTSMNNPILLFQITSSEMKINAVHCNAYFGFGYYCVASIIYNNTVYYYKEIAFYSTTIIDSEQLFNTPNEASVLWNVSSTPFGGYVFSALVNSNCLIHIYDIDRDTNYPKVNLTTTGIGAYNILKNNNSFLFSLRDINGKNASWSLLAVQLPETPN